ncbi:SDR family oxidoreductase [Viridibacterium curvum]|uniref:SDR family oxidoreductase n=1 Tax=Viridibacterium curvum TaxID=1101404 RepID=A0ABP9QBW4_9RHOO
MSEKILVLGANGNVGRPLVQALLAKGERVKAASRSGTAIGGAEGAVFDYDKPETFATAFDGVDRAYVLLPGGNVNSRELLTPVIEALAARKVKVVLQTALGVDADDSIPYRQVELALERSGTPCVILRPNWFADNFHNFWLGGILQGNIALPAGEGKTSFIDVRDIAASAAAVLTTHRFDGQAFNLTGATAHSYAEAATLIGSTIDKPVRYTAIDDETFVRNMVQIGLSEAYARFLAMIFYPVREGWTAAVNDTVQTLTGQPARSLQDYLRDHVRDLKG